MVGSHSWHGRTIFEERWSKLEFVEIQGFNDLPHAQNWRDRSYRDRRGNYAQIGTVLPLDYSTAANQASPFSLVKILM